MKRWLGKNLLFNSYRCVSDIYGLIEQCIRPNKNNTAMPLFEWHDVKCAELGVNNITIHVLSRVIVNKAWSETDASVNETVYQIQG